MYFLPLAEFIDLAAKPIFTGSDWEVVPTSFDDAHRPNVTADLFCGECEKEKTFLGKAYSRTDLGIKYQQENNAFGGNQYMPFFEDDSETDTVEEMIDECVLPVGDTVTVQLKCPTCGSPVYVCYVIEYNKKQDRIRNVFEDAVEGPDEYRVTKIGEHPNQEATRLHNLQKYKIRFPEEYQLLAQAERAYRNSLGAGAMVYVRKAYETLLFRVLDERSIDRPNTFKQLLRCADDAAHIVPAALSDKAYGLFGEISDIVHGDTNDEWGLSKFENLRDVFTHILSHILEKEHQEELASKIKSDDSASNRKK